MNRIWHGVLHRMGMVLFAATTVIAAGGSLAFAQTFQLTAPGPSQPSASQLPSRQALENWRKSVLQAPQPTTGCLVATYPSLQWQQVPCTTPPTRPYKPARGPRPTFVGNGNDVVAQVSGLISQAEGSFDSVTGVTSETGAVTEGGPQVANTFSLQLNTNFFSTPACNGAAGSQCKGWEQFVYSNEGQAFIQYWLINYDSTCPAGWFTSQDGGAIDCWKNGINAVQVPRQTIANLANLGITGRANNGGFDRLYMSTGDHVYSPNPPDPANVLNAFQSWTAAEFNIFGDSNKSQANFNSGASVAVRVSVSSNTSDPPTCGMIGFTAETNNLNFASPALLQGPPLSAIVFTESSAVGIASPCAAAASGQLLVSPVTDISSTGPPGGPFTPASFIYEIRSSGGCIYYQVVNAGPKPGQPPGTAGWFDINPQSGQVCETPIAIAITLNAQAKALAVNTYGPSFVGFIIPTVFDSGSSRTANLTVTAPVSTSFRFLPLPNTPPGPHVGPAPPDDFRSTRAQGASLDGHVIVGTASSPTNFGTVRWDETSWQLLPVTVPGTRDIYGPFGANQDGTVIVGNGACGGFRWTKSNNQAVPLPPVSGDSCDQVWSVDAAGVVAAGSDGSTATVWTTTSPRRLTLPQPARPGYVAVYGVSGDGSTAVGCVNGQSVRWNTATLAAQILPALAPNQPTCARAANQNGTIVVGWAVDANGVQQPVRWVSGGPPQSLSPSDVAGMALATSADGSVVVGVNNVVGVTGNQMAFRWTQVDGMQSVQSLLAKTGFDVSGWALTDAVAVSSDGLTIVGNAMATSGSGYTQGWVGRLPAPQPSSILSKQLPPRL
jgi:uncharacterized membrane protein